MTQITLAQNVSEMDAPSMLDENRLSTILWKKGEGASFNVFDLTSGKALVTEALGLKDPENERSQGAPRKPIID